MTWFDWLGGAVLVFLIITDAVAYRKAPPGLYRKILFGGFVFGLLLLVLWVLLYLG